MRKKQGFPLWGIISFIVFTLIFKKWPEIDLYVSNFFFEGGRFPLSMEFNIFIKVIDRFIEFGCIALWITFVVRLARKEYKNYGLQYTTLMRKLFYISSVGLLGSVGAVHFIKRYIKRCRPNYIEYFGGPSPFTEIWTRNFSEAINVTKCVSFVSGHSAIGFLIYAIAFTFPIGSRDRLKFILLGTVVGGIFGLIRIIQGQHFLSDVIFSGYVVYFSGMVLSVFFKPSDR